MNDYRAPWWQWGGHLQTLVAALWAQRGAPCGLPLNWLRERWETPDGDCIDVDWRLAQGLGEQGGTDTAGAPLLVLFHGLEGSSRSHYAQALAGVCAQRGWHLVVPHFRGCGGTPNRLARAYHSGDAPEVDWILRRLRQHHGRPVFAMGVSLGGNALALWAGLHQENASSVVRALAVVSAPLDLVASGTQLGRGLNRWLYTPMFLRTLVPKVLAKEQQFPGLLQRSRLVAVRDLRAFDDAYTAPVHGFVDALDYWCRASAKPVLRGVAVPLLLINARNDPFVPARSLPDLSEVSASVQLWQPRHGGHVGFAEGPGRGHVLGLPQSVLGWMQQWLPEQERKHVR